MGSCPQHAQGARVMAREEIQKINSAHGIDSSVLPYELDYSQFKPQNHYTRRPEMERYFKVMMWFGNVRFPLKSRYMLNVGLMNESRSILMTYTLFSGMQKMESII